MPTQSVFHWLDGRGWLVFSGGSSDEIRAAALGRMAADGGIACITFADDPDHLLDDLADLGAPPAYLVDVFGEDDITIRDQLTQAGMIVIEGGDSALEIRGALRGAALEGMQAAYENGALILLEGAGAAAFAGWLIEDDVVETGLEWLIGALVLIGVRNAAPYAKPVLDVQPTAIAVAIMPESALALGPDGEIETWGLGEVTVALGAAYGT